MTTKQINLHSQIVGDHIKPKRKLRYICKIKKEICKKIFCCRECEKDLDCRMHCLRHPLHCGESYVE